MTYGVTPSSPRQALAAAAITASMVATQEGKTVGASAPVARPQ